MQRIAEWNASDADTFRREIASEYRPAVLRGLVREWPAVRHATRSAEALATYLGAFDNGTPVDAILMPPQVRGRIFYDEGMAGFNFLRRQLPISTVIEQVMRYAAFPAPPSVAVQSAPIAQCLPGFLAENVAPVLPASIAPRIWLGNMVVTPAHFDESSNLACVVGGRRRFTLLPPEQAANLYVGPLDFAPTGTPISLVSFREPDFERFPRFEQALAAAQVAELDPGDAIYIPTLWWHHVESLSPFNVLVNYWWKGPVDAPIQADSALDCLLHSLLNLNHVTADEKLAWRALFDHFVFNPAPDRADHIAPHRRGLHGEIGPEHAARIRAFLLDKLRR